MADPILASLRAVTSAGSTPLTYLRADGSPTSDLAEATDVSLPDGDQVPLDTATAFFAAGKGYLPVRAIVFLWALRDAPFGDYLTSAFQHQVAAVGFQERNELVEWLRGAKDRLDVGHAPAAQEMGGVGADGDTVMAEASQVPPTAAASLAYRERRNEYTLRSRGTYLTPPGNKQFSHLTKLCYDIFIRNKPPPTAVSAMHGDTPSSKRAKGKSTGLSAATGGAPADAIILVPPGFNTLLNMYNVKQFLDRATFEPADAVRAKGDAKPAYIEMTRKGLLGGKKSLKVLICDSVDRLEPGDWDRVVAVFAGGMAWQFHGYKWATPVELFTRVRGYHLKYHDEETSPAVNAWNVRVFSVHRSKRHLDQPLVLDIWADLEKWIATNKPHLLP
ncbi:accessory factor associated with RNA polymerase II [Allomyces arbusculus]|nr:accessory factor associated with RNA polymerase II [Allomyces arbusculus]